MTHVKVCGITNLDDARAALTAGADSLGFNFYERSSRHVAPTIVREIIEQLDIDRTRCVGVFVNHGEPDQVRQTAAAAGVGAVQLHGDEPPDYLRRLADFYTIKALRAGADFDAARAAAEYAGADAVLLDAYSPLAPGGTGRTFDWALAVKVERSHQRRLYLAGGLTADNVAAAIAAVRPDAVDVCGGVEAVGAPRRKDHGRMEKFLCAARAASAIVMP